MTTSERAPADTTELEERLSAPSAGVIDALRDCAGDVIILGAAGKMGPTLARMARRALDAAGSVDRVIAVSRFSTRATEDAIAAHGVETVRCDLLDRDAVARLPDAPNVVFMAGQKFGTSDAPALTWAMNTIVPAHCAERYAHSRIVAFSTGNVYPLSPATRGGARESDSLAPAGEYAMSCLGRERVLEFHSVRHGTRVAIVRLNYAVDLRYGVLVDIAQKVMRGEPVDVRMGWANVIWQGDASARALMCLPLVASPPFVINVTGAETLSVRALALRFGELLGRAPVLAGQEASDALLSDASRSFALFGPPAISTDTLVDWVAAWLRSGGTVLGKPTHFEERAGAF